MLNEKPKSTATFVDKKAALLEMLKDMSEEERMELMAGLSNRHNHSPQEHQVKYRKNTEQTTTKIQSKTPQKHKVANRISNKISNFAQK